MHLDFYPAFVATPNARNVAMLREAADFAAALKRCEKDIRGVKTAAEGREKRSRGWRWRARP